MKIRKVLIAISLVASSLAITPSAVAVMTCTAGSTFNSTTGLCDMDVETVTPINKKTSYYCLTGGTLNGLICSYPATVTPAESATVTNCQSSTATLLNGICSEPPIYRSGYSAGAVQTILSCPNGGYLSGASCITQTAQAGYYYYYDYDYSGSGCYAGGTKTGSLCKVYVPAVLGQSYPATSTQYCSIGTPSNGQCIVEGYYDPAYTYPAITYTDYSCPDGYPPASGNVCNTEASTAAALIGYSGICPVHYLMNPESGFCEAESYEPIDQGEITSYKCITTYKKLGTFIEFYAYDASIAKKKFTRQCNLLITTESSLEDSYLCTTTADNLKVSVSYLADYDQTGETSIDSTYCSYVGEPIEEPTAITSEDFYFPPVSTDYCDPMALGLRNYLTCVAQYTT